MLLTSTKRCHKGVPRPFFYTRHQKCPKQVPSRGFHLRLQVTKQHEDECTDFLSAAIVKGLQSFINSPQVISQSESMIIDLIQFSFAWCPILLLYRSLIDTGNKCIESPVKALTKILSENLSTIPFWIPIGDVCCLPSCGFEPMISFLFR
jgi:hypothetical protein